MKANARNKWVLILFIPEVFLFSCLKPDYSERAVQYLKKGDIENSYENYRQAMYEDSDDCDVLLGYIYTTEKVFDKKITNWNKYLKTLISKEISPEKKLSAIRKADKIKSFFENHLNIRISPESLKEVKKDVKKWCKNEDCQIEYAYYRFEDLKRKGSGFLFFKKECSVKAFVKKYNLKSTFDHKKLLVYRQVIQHLRKKYKTARENALIEHKNFTVIKIKKLLTKGNFVNAIQLINKEIKLLKSFGKNKALNQLKEFKKRTLQSIASYIKEKFQECKDSTCKRALYLYIKVFPENIALKLPHFWNYENIKNKYCINYQINGGNNHLQESLIKNLKNLDKYFMSGGNCQNHIEFNLSDDFKKSTYVNSNFFKAPYFDMPVETFKRLTEQLDTLQSAENICDSCGGTYFDCYSRVSTAIGGILTPVANIFEYQSRWEAEMNRCNLIQDYTARMRCISNVNRRLEEYYKQKLQNLCYRIKRKVSQIRSRLNYSLRWLTWKEIYYTYVFKLDYSVSFFLTYLNKEYSKSYSDTVEDTIKETDYKILSGDYNLACKYANYIGSWCKYQFTCRRPYTHTPPDEYKEKKYLSRAAGRNIVTNLEKAGLYPNALFKNYINQIKDKGEKISKVFEYYILYEQIPINKEVIINYVEDNIFK